MMRDVSYHTSNRDLELRKEQNMIFILFFFLGGGRFPNSSVE